MADEIPDERDEEWQVYRWRRLQLEQLGFSVKDAKRLAGDPTVDWHHVRELLRAGCPRELAGRIG